MKRYAPLLVLLTCSAAWAGTGQIFSPSGLPESSTQTYTPPTPDNMPTVSFPTPPLPLGEGVLQSFPGSSFPLNHGTQKPTVTSAENNPAQPFIPSSLPTSSVESFFQCNPVSTTPTSPNKPKQSILKSTGKVIWHTLDNLGVPMFVGKDNDLDPSLSKAYVMPPPAISSKTIAPVTPQKIPESELDGIDGSQKNDQTLPLH